MYIAKNTLHERTTKQIGNTLGVFKGVCVRFSLLCFILV